MECIMIQFQLPDMTCGHCSKTVTNTVQQVEPGVQVDIDLERHVATIHSNGDRAAFAKALTEAGYPPAN